MSVKKKQTDKTQRDFSAAKICYSTTVVKISHFTSSESIDFTIGRGEPTVNHE